MFQSSWNSVSCKRGRKCREPAGWQCSAICVRAGCAVLLSMQSSINSALSLSFDSKTSMLFYGRNMIENCCLLKMKRKSNKDCYDSLLRAKFTFVVREGLSLYFISHTCCWRLLVCSSRCGRGIFALLYTPSSQRKRQASPSLSLVSHYAEHISHFYFYFFPRRNFPKPRIS